MCQTCTELLHEALNLAARGEEMAAQDRREATIAAPSDPEAWQADGAFDRYVERHNIQMPYAEIATRSMTMHLWVQDQYDKDLHAWTQKARAHLSVGGGCSTKEAD